MKIGDKVKWSPARRGKTKGRVSAIDGAYVEVMVKIDGKKYPFNFLINELQLRCKK